MARDLHELTLRLNRLRDRKREIESLAGRQLADMSSARVSAIKREYRTVCTRIARLEARLR